MKIKKFVKFLLISFIALACFTACSKDEEPSSQQTTTSSVNTAPIVASINASKTTKIIFGDALGLSTSAQIKKEIL